MTDQDRVVYTREANGFQIVHTANGFVFAQLNRLLHRYYCWPSVQFQGAYHKFVKGEAVWAQVCVYQPFTYHSWMYGQFQHHCGC